MRRFNVVTQILDEAVGGTKIGAHGNFWRGVSLDQFVALRVFGRPLIQAGDGANSNLVKALRGQTPFGRDLTPKPPGALFPRMPLGMSPVAESSIAFIARWIDDGCPDEEAETAALHTAAAAAGQDDLFVAFFREFDDFFMFKSAPSTGEDINTFMGDAANAWPGWSSQRDVGAWTNAIQTPLVREAVESLAASQLQIINGHFGAPVDANGVAEALWRFGAGSLPPDPQRPVAPQHRMDGATMWLVWLACCDAALRLQVDAEWQRIARAVAGGLVADALFRTDRPSGDRLAITRYQANNPDVKQQVLADLAGVADDALLDHNIGLGREAMGEALVA